MIEEQRVNSIVLEYSHFWSAKFKTLAEDMSAKGYDGYFLGSHCILPFSSLVQVWGVLVVVGGYPKLVHKGKSHQNG